MLPVNEASSSS